MNREIGSSFYKLEIEDKVYQALADHKIEFKDDVRVYNSGRSAMRAILETIHAKRTPGTIWVPEYYCHNVTAFLERNYSSIRYYYIDPFDCDQDFNFEEFCTRNDVILLNNYWGLFEYNYNTESKDRPTIIEDHSHGWLSTQSLESKADYCLASVRKTYPVPIGGIAWQPGQNNFGPGYEDGLDETMDKAYLTLKQSMIKKRDYLKSGKGKKDIYLNLLSMGESLISASNSYSRPDAGLYAAIESYIKFDVNKVKAANLKVVLGHLNSSEHFRIINRKGHTPFGLLLLFRDKDIFDQFKAFCLKRHIYPANLWPDNDLRTPWKYFFNIHVDFRYDADDMKYLANCINEWTEKSVPTMV